MAGNKNSGRPAKQNAVRTSIIIDRTILAYLNRKGNVSAEIERLARQEISTGGEYGSVTFDGKTYILLDVAVLSNRVFPGWWGDAEDGEDYTAEYIANAIGDDGCRYQVTWQFPEVKGEEPEDEGNYPWDDGHIYRVEMI